MPRRSSSASGVGRSPGGAASRNAPKPLVAPVRLERRLGAAGGAALAAAVGGSLLPFWPAPLLAAIVLAVAVTTLRAPRIGLALALAAPVFPLGNVAQGAAVVYGVLALAWLAVVWRDARAGALFLAGPLLAPLGLLGLLPLAVQPARALWRRGLQAGTGVFAAAAVAGVSGRPVPLGGGVVGDLGVAGTERPTDVVQALGLVLRETPAIATTALALAVVAVLRSTCRRARPVGNRRSRRIAADPRLRVGAVGPVGRHGGGDLAALWHPRRAALSAPRSGDRGAAGPPVDSIGGGSPVE